MRRKRKSLLPDTPLPVPSDILDQFVGQRLISPEELAQNAVSHSAHPHPRCQEEKEQTVNPLNTRNSDSPNSIAQSSIQSANLQSNRPIFNPIAQSSIQSANLQSNRPIFNPQCNLQSSVCNRQLLIRPMA
jgi:hypothetical protein